MQNIPGIALEKATEQAKAVQFSTVKKSDQQELFADLFDQHSARIENELALTPVSTEENMLEVAPDITTTDTQAPVNASNVEAPVQEVVEPPVEDAPVHDQDQKMTQEDLDAVRDDLKEYGLTEEEIAEIEEEINSEDGLTWGQFVSTLADKMASMRKVELTGEQKEQLNTFFAKFGFSDKESAKLISQLEKGNTADVMAALQKKIDAMPEGQQLLFTKDEVQAFSAAMNFSKEFTSKVKEVFGQNLMAKEVKEAFTMIRQEMADMDQKDQNLVRAVGKAFVAAMKDNHKETAAAKDLDEAVDLKPRVAEEAPKATTKEDVKQAVDQRKDSMPESQARKATEQKTLPEQAKPEVDLTDQGQQEAFAQTDDSDNHWNNFFAKLQGDSAGQQAPATQFQAKTETIESLLKTGLAEANTQTKTQAWEKISAPKVMRQVENAFIQNLGNGTKQLSLELNPNDLGKLNIMLQVNGKEVSATIKADNAEAAKLIADNIDIIKSSLENQGLKVEKLEVQSGLSNNMNNQDWFGSNEHNLARERETMVAMRNHMKQMREENLSLAQDVQSNLNKANHADQGLHVIA